MSAGRSGGAGAETIRLEEYTGLIQNKLIAVWHSPDTATPWLPTEFMLSQYITRILVTGRASPLSVALAADSSWTQIWRAPGGKEWSCLLGILQYMPGPILLVVGPDMPLTAKLVSSLQSACGASPTTAIVLRQPGGQGWVGDAADHVFFPVVEVGTAKSAGVMAVIQEWAGRSTPRHLDFKAVLPQLAAQGYALTVAEGEWHWYKPADSEPMATLSVPQIARQLQILGTVLERIPV
jgi:hypothetical protein